MSTWNELFLNDKHIEMPAESEVLRFAGLLRKKFPNQKLNVWDLCCGGGRHTVALARFGFHTFASDNAPNGVEHTKRWLEEEKLTAECTIADMTDNPWKGVQFHGIVCWNSINHNYTANIQKTIDTIYEALVPNGLLLVTLKSTKADGYGKGRGVEVNTFVPDEGHESGVLHHYFDYDEIKALFCRWKFLALCEEVIKNYEQLDKFWQYTPFRHTTWGALLEKNNVG